MLLCSALFAAHAHAEPERLHSYRVALDAALETIKVSACFAGTAPSELVSGSARASPYVREVYSRHGPERFLTPEHGVIQIPARPAGSCLDYVVDFGVELKWRVNDTPRRVGKDLLVAQGLWLWRPRHLAADEDIDLAFDLPQGIAVSAPWRKVGASYRVGHAPHDWPGWVAFGRFTPQQIRVTGSVLEVAVLDGSPAADETAIGNWLREAAQAVAMIYGRFPTPTSQLLVLPMGNGAEAVPWGQVIRGRSAIGAVFR